MRHTGVFILGLAIASACQSSPTAPYVIEAPRVAPVATAKPYVWESADELVGWVKDGVSTGAVSVKGDGIDAVIRVDLSGGPASLHGPDLDPPLADVQEVRMRYRWFARNASDRPQVYVYLRPPQVSDRGTMPRLFPQDFSEILSGAWLEKTLSTWMATHPTYPVMYGFISVSSATSSPQTTDHWTLEIDRIELVRSGS
jgi:hypothetical protein